MKKTAEEIFNEASKGKYIFGSVDLKIAKDQHHVVYNAMEEYKDQHTAPLIEVLERINGMSQETGRYCCTYNDTDFDSESVAYGYNLVLDRIKQDIETALLNAKV